MKVAVASRRSLRQTEILLQLANARAGTITELAVRMEGQRPSISRALHALREQGLVDLDRAGWHLTRLGQAEAEAAKAEVAGMAEDAQAAIKRAIGVWNRMGLSEEMVMGINTDFYAAARALEPILRQQEQYRSLVDPILKHFNSTLSTVTASLPSPSELSIVMASLPSPSEMAAMRQWAASTTPLVEAQRRNADLLRQITSSMQTGGLESVIRQNNLFLAGAIDNVLAIRQSELARVIEEAQAVLDHPAIAAKLADVSRAYDGLFRSTLETWEPAQLMVSSPQLAERLFVPTATVTYYTGAVRDLIEAEAEADTPLQDRQEAGEYGDWQLDAPLGALDPDFVVMRRGSWSALSSNGPDCLRQAAVSQRELIRRLLGRLVPDVEIADDGSLGSRFKAKVKLVVGDSDSDAEWVEAVAKAVFSTQNQLHKFTHTNQKHAESLRGLLQTGEGLIRFILARVDSVPASGE